VPDHQHAPVGGDGGDHLECLGGVEAATQRLVHGQQGALLRVPALGSQLRGLTGAHLGAEQDRVKDALHACQGDARRARLLAPTLGQTTLGVRAGAVWLRLRVTK
jgi:hypothetical protein